MYILGKISTKILFIVIILLTLKTVGFSVIWFDPVYYSSTVGDNMKITQSLECLAQIAENFNYGQSL